MRSPSNPGGARDGGDATLPTPPSPARVRHARTTTTRAAAERTHQVPNRRNHGRGHELPDSVTFEAISVDQTAWAACRVCAFVRYRYIPELDRSPARFTIWPMSWVVNDPPNM